METKNVPFDQVLFQLFFDMVRSTGQGLNLDQIEKVRTASTRMAATLETQVQLVVYGILKEFQANMKAAIEELRNELKNNPTT